MTKAFVDSDVIIRFLTGDDSEKQQHAAALFTAVERGEIRLMTPATAIADVVYVLASPNLYRLDRQTVRDLLLALLRPAEFRVEAKPVVTRALEIYGATPVDFGDAMIAAAMQQHGVATLYTYDHHFDRFQHIERLDPAA